MGFSRKQPEANGIDEAVENLSENLDGFVLVGYRKGDHEKVIIEQGSDPACRDALSFFGTAIQLWINLGGCNEEESGDE